MATFGKTVAGSTWAVANNDLYASLRTAPEDGTVTSISIYTLESVGNIKGIILDSDKNILAVGSGVAAVADSWVTCVLSTPQPISGSVDYYLGCIWDNSGLHPSTSTSGGTGIADSSNDYASPTNPTDASANSWDWSVYATYTPSAGGSAYSDSLNEALGFTDAVSITQTINRSVVDSLGISDSTSRTIVGTAVVKGIRVFGDEGLIS